ncbi:MAG: NAD(P)-dependent oxidoreductase [Flavobacteriales bacterium]
MKVLFIDTTHPILYSIFENKGWEVVVKDKATKEELASELNDYQGIIVRSRFELDKDFITKGTNLQFIGRPGAGLENIDVEFAESKGIQVFRSPEGNRDSVAEQGIGMLLMLFNKLQQANIQVKAGIWDRLANRGEELMGKTVGLIGYGVMGKAMAQRLSGFGVTCIAYDKYLTNYGNEHAKAVSLKVLYEKSEVVSLHTPLTEETKDMINEAYLSKFKNPIYFLNTARGQSVVLYDLVKLMKNGKVMGACLDVLEYEKTSFESMFNENKTEAFEYLAQAENVILSPHVAGWTHQSNVKIAQFLGEKIVKEF